MPHPTAQLRAALFFGKRLYNVVAFDAPRTSGDPDSRPPNPSLTFDSFYVKSVGFCRESLAKIILQ